MSDAQSLEIQQNTPTMSAPATRRHGGRSLLRVLLESFRENLDAFAGAADAYYGDAVYYNAKLIEMYDATVPRIDRPLGQSPRP